jgi:hypothetical protein
MDPVALLLSYGDHYVDSGGAITRMAEDPELRGSCKVVLLGKPEI